MVHEVKVVGSRVREVVANCSIGLVSTGDEIHLRLPGLLAFRPESVSLTTGLKTIF